MNLKSGNFIYKYIHYFPLLLEILDYFLKT